MKGSTIFLLIVIFNIANNTFIFNRVLRNVAPESAELISNQRMLFEDPMRKPTNIGLIINGDWRGWFKFFRNENPVFAKLLADQCIHDFCYTDCVKTLIGYDLRVCIVGQKLCIEGDICKKLKQKRLTLKNIDLAAYQKAYYAKEQISSKKASNLMKKHHHKKRFISRKNFLHNLNIIKQNIKMPSQLTPKQTQKDATILSDDSLASIPQATVEHKKKKKVVKPVHQTTSKTDDSNSDSQ